MFFQCFTFWIVIKWPNHVASAGDISPQVSLKVLTLDSFVEQDPCTLLWHRSCGILYRVRKCGVFFFLAFPEINDIRKISKIDSSIPSRYYVLWTTEQSQLYFKSIPRYTSNYLLHSEMWNNSTLGWWPFNTKSKPWFWVNWLQF